MEIKMIEGYRIVEIKDNKIMSLYHGTNKSRIIPLNIWYKANKKFAYDGSGGKYYETGWHFLPTLEEAQLFFDKMFRIKINRCIVRCYLRGNIRRKERSKSWLADEILIKAEDIVL
jgi:hypothetical protein